jgi:hypothetical protein
MLAMRRAGVTVFDPLPAPPPPLAWPTGRRDLFTAPEFYFARTRANPEYGRPGWTRDCGKRFHRGCDIAPARVVETGRVTTVLFSNCEDGREYPSEEPVVEPDDDVFAVCPGEVVEVNTQASESDFGIFVVLHHAWPDGGAFFTLYGHLAETGVRLGQVVRAGAPLGRMGTTSRSADARNWMAVAPHLHFEVVAGSGGAHDPAAFLASGLSRSGGVPRA